MRFVIIALIAACSLFSASASSEEAVHVSVSPTVAQSPATVFVRVIVAHDQNNRELEISVDGDQFYRSSAMTLEGAEAPRVYQLTFSGVPAGSYSVSACVRRVRGETTAHAELIVSGFAQ